MPHHTKNPRIDAFAAATGALLAIVLLMRGAWVMTASVFPDVSDTHPYADVIGVMKDDGIFLGMPDGTFGPDKTINRAEITAIILRARGGAQPACAQQPFPDVMLTDWFATAVCAAKEEGTVGGYANGLFLPAQSVTFAEFARIAAGAFRLPMGAESEPWYARYVLALQTAHAVPSSIRDLAQKPTRGEVAYVLTKILHPEFIDRETHIQMERESRELLLHPTQVIPPAPVPSTQTIFPSSATQPAPAPAPLPAAPSQTSSSPTIPAAAPAPAACVPIITEFATPSAGSRPLGIAAGSDGNMWYTDDNNGKVGKIRPDGTITEYATPTAISIPGDIVRGPDGNMWFTERGADKIGRITPDGTITEFAVSTRSLSVANYPAGIAVGSDGNLWFGDTGGSDGPKIMKMTTAGDVTGSASIGVSGVSSIAPGPDGNIWFTRADGVIGIVTPAGQVSQFGNVASTTMSRSITPGPDGNMWFAEGLGNAVGRISMSGVVTRFPIAYPEGGVRPMPMGIVAGPDGNMWFTEYTGKIGMITTGGVITEFPTTSNRNPDDIAAGPNGTLWFTDARGKIGRITCAGQ